ncbi:MAG: hypothetical protein J1G38_04415 [Clostridiales bacterium]|nr:hypothetical protein [Clostridiales bacterium]
MKQKILLTYIESGFGHISSLDSIHAALEEQYSDVYDIQKSYIMRDDGLPHLQRMEKFIIKQVQNTNRLPWFGDFAFTVIRFFGSDHLMRFFHRQMNGKSWKEGLAALEKRKPDVIVTNHYFTNMLAVDYKQKIDPEVKIINYNPDCTLHTFWDKRDGIFVVNNKYAFDRALKFKFKKENLREVAPCVRECVEQCNLTRQELREKHGLPQDKFTVAIADGGYMMGRGPKFAKALIKSGLPITMLVIAGDNEERYEEFTAIAEGRGKLKLGEGATLKVYRFMKEAYELYGAADLLLTKGGPNAVLDSIYMDTPVMINYSPHVIEKGTVRTYIRELGCGEKQGNRKKAVKRISQMMTDRTDLDAYAENIKKLKEKGNGASAVAAIIDGLAKEQREARRDRGIIYDCDNADDDKPQAEGVESVGAEHSEMTSSQ